MPVGKRVKYIAIGAKGLGSIPEPVQSDAVSPTALHAVSPRSVATAAIFLRSCVAQMLSRGDGSAARYTLRCNIATVMKV